MDCLPGQPHQPPARLLSVSVWCCVLPGCTTSASCTVISSRSTSCCSMATTSSWTTVAASVPGRWPCPASRPGIAPPKWRGACWAWMLGTTDPTPCHGATGCAAPAAAARRVEAAAATRVAAAAATSMCPAGAGLDQGTGAVVAGIPTALTTAPRLLALLLLLPARSRVWMRMEMRVPPVVTSRRLRCPRCRGWWGLARGPRQRHPWPCPWVVAVLVLAVGVVAGPCPRLPHTSGASQLASCLRRCRRLCTRDSGARAAMGPTRETVTPCHRTHRPCRPPWVPGAGPRLHTRSATLSRRSRQPRSRQTRRRSCLSARPAGFRGAFAPPQCWGARYLTH